MKPIRIQRKRIKGWKAPENTISVTRPGKWGNPFKVGDRSPNNYNMIIDAEHSVELFEQMLDSKHELGIFEAYIKPLKGKNLMCFCAIDQPCHADILLKMANQD
jgi:hypothetical protein